MPRCRALIITLSLVVSTLPASAQDSSVGDAETMIGARRELMAEIERLMIPIDLGAIGESVSAADPRSNAVSIATMLDAFPHLFPDATNRYDSQTDLPITLALPAVWSQAALFVSMSETASQAAVAVGNAQNADSLVVAAQHLRASCDACHALFLAPYTPANVSSEDLEFDFDSLFESIETR